MGDKDSQLGSTSEASSPNGSSQHTVVKLFRVAPLLILSLVLFTSSIDKIVHFPGFVNALRDYAIIPLKVAEFIALPIIVVETFLGCSLLIRTWRYQAALWTSGLFLLFAGVLAANYAFGGRGICGCWFTVTLATGTVGHIALNIFLAALALVWRFENRVSIPRQI